ncbi:MAG: hypothetical protein ACFFAU_09875 [Candidatus Hodarchaeota archaeon]
MGMYRGNLEDQMRLSLRAILSKQMNGGEDKHLVIASFVSDDNGFPLTGLKRNNGSIVEMETEEYEYMCAFIPQLWDSATPSSESFQFLEENINEVNHLTIGYRKKGETKPYLEIMITRLEEFFLSSVYCIKK